MAGCLKNVLVVVGGVAQGDVVTAQEVQVRGEGVLWGRQMCSVLAPAGLPDMSATLPPVPPLSQGYGVSMLGFMLYSAARRQQQAPAPKQA